MKDTPKGQDARIQNIDFRSDSVALPVAAPTGSPVLSAIGSYETGIFDESAAEITSYDPKSERLLLVNANTSTVDILSLSDPTSPILVNSIDIQAILGDENTTVSPNSVDIANGLVAVAIGAEDTTSGNPGIGMVGFFDIDGNYLTKTFAGYLPDMLTFTPDNSKLVVVNEGEPNDDYTLDPEGSVSIISTRQLSWTLLIHKYFPFWSRFFPIRSPHAHHANFTRFNSKEAALKNAGVRIFGPGATVAQDLEPEYIAVSDDSRTAYVTLQENNAIAIVDLRLGSVRSVKPLGYKDFSLSGFDPSNRDDNINIQPWPVLGMYQPDAIAGFTINGRQFLISANEGDARDHDGFSEEVRLKDLTLDPTAFPDANDLQEDEMLGRLRITDATGDTDGDGDLDQIYAYGGRSFSIWRATRRGIRQVYDSGSDIENATASLIPAEFNSNNDENDSFDSRSDDKGPEPEGVTVGKVNGQTLAFIGLERVGGVLVYDISNPRSPVYLQYVVTRDFFGDAETGTAGDLGPEGLTFISASDSPNGKPLLVVASEVSGSVRIFEIN